MHSSVLATMNTRKLGLPNIFSAPNPKRSPTLDFCPFAGGGVWGRVKA